MLTKASARPSLTSWAPTRIEEAVFSGRRGCPRPCRSPRARRRWSARAAGGSCRAELAADGASRPTRRMSRSNSWAARRAPGTVALGPKSPPIASTAIFMVAVRLSLRSLPSPAVPCSTRTRGRPGAAAWGCRTCSRRRRWEGRARRGTGVCPFLVGEWESLWIRHLTLVSHRDFELVPDGVGLLDQAGAIAPADDPAADGADALAVPARTGAWPGRSGSAARGRRRAGRAGGPL